MREHERPERTRKARQQLLARPLIAVGALFALYGVFALIYRGDGSGPTTVELAGHRVNAHLAGGASLAVGATLIAAGLAIARSRA